MGITTAQLYLTNPKFRFCAGSNLACVVAEIYDGENLRQWAYLEVRLIVFSIEPFHKTIYHHYHHHLLQSHETYFEEHLALLTLTIKFNTLNYI